MRPLVYCWLVVSGILFATQAVAAEDTAALCARTAKDGNVEACREAVAADGRDLISRRNLALAYLSKQDDERCFSTHAEIVALAPDEAESHFGYAAALATFGHYETALPFVRTALRLAPSDLAIVQLAALLFEMTGHEDEAFGAFRRGAELGDPRLMFDLAMAYARGVGTAPNPRESFAWFERAAAAGHVTAMLRLADMYRSGDGVAPDTAQAAFWAERARVEGMAD
jgi:TPR repeat protein